MTGTMEELLAAACVWLVSHWGLAARPVRTSIVDAIGENGFRAVYSLIAIAVLVWVGFAFAAAPPGPLLWSFGIGAAHLAAAMMVVPFLFIVAGLSGPNPTALGSETALREPEPTKGMMRITRHPGMWGIGLWGVLHLIANGDLRSVVLFGTMALTALVGTVLIDAKKLRKLGGEYASFKMATSNLPFAAAIAGRQPVGRALAEIGLIRVLVAIALYAGFVYIHGWLFGVPVFPGLPV